MNLVPIFTITDSAFPSLSGLSRTFGSIPLSGIVGGLIGNAINGKELDASLNLSENGDVVTEKITFTSTIPFIGGILKPITTEQTVDTEVANVLRGEFGEISALANVQGKLTFNVE
jgi:hypothetical protein